MQGGGRLTLWRRGRRRLANNCIRAHGASKVVIASAADPEIRMPELALDDHQGHALARHPHRVSMAQLMRREAPAHAGYDGAAAQFGCGAPLAGRTVRGSGRPARRTAGPRRASPQLKYRV
jgi:hypothetical protein